MEYQSRERRITFLICGLLLFSVVLGCRQLASRNYNRSLNNRGLNGNSRQAKSSDGLTEKTNLYIKQCVNNYSNSVIGSYRRYASWMRDVEKGPTGKEDIVYGLYEIRGDGQDCVDAIKKAKEMEPEISEAESAADRYATALKEVIGQIKTIYPYYNHADYKDDSFQKGKAAHPALLAAFKNFELANKTFDTEVEKLEDAVANKRLNELKGDSSKKYEYLVVDTGIKSKNIIKFVKQTEYSQIKAENLQPLIDDFEKSVNDLKSAAANKALGSFYVSSCDNFLIASKELMRRVRDKKAFSDFERRELGTSSGWMVDGSPDKLINKYNEMIQRRGMGA
ncbi:MAG TPA: YiiG family protein [Pyrinomonadaceae bacterium]|nr:YiiG family protein [Pyrinomonadaceae bacterium]